MASGRTFPRWGLWFKLTLAFLLVSLVGVGLVALLANRVTTAEFRQYMIRGQLTDSQELAEGLETFYAQNGSWEGAASILGERRGQGRGSTSSGAGFGQGQFYLADIDGRIVAGASSDRLGEQLDAKSLAEGLPLEVEGQQVGTLLVVHQAWGAIEQQFLEQVNRAFLWGGLGAIAAALLLGTFLAWRISTPVRKLTQIAERIAAGDLSGRVTVRSRDEIGQLATTFNRMTDNLARADALRRRMTADIAHELRTPLSIIRGQVEALQDGIFPADAEHLAPIQDETMLLNRLVEDLRTLALAEAGQLALQKSEVDLVTLVERMASKFRPLGSEKGIALTVDAPRALPPVVMDAHRIEQVLTNLLANAVRHTPKGGEVLIRVRDERELLIQIVDSGPGIPVEDLPYVFDRFWRGDRSRARDRGGSGLGLAIARQLVALHGGRIWVENGPERGAVFSLALPFD